MKKILYLDEARQHTLSAGPKHLMRLTPGRNEVEEDVFDAVMGVKDSRLEDMIKKGTIKVLGDTVDISKMNVKKALEIVELETTVDGLGDLRAQEDSRKDSRKTILEAIDARIEIIEAANDAGGDDDDED